MAGGKERGHKLWMSWMKKVLSPSVRTSVDPEGDRVVGITPVVSGRRAWEYHSSSARKVGRALRCASSHRRTTEGEQISAHNPHGSVIPETRRRTELAGQASLPLTSEVLAAYNAVVIVTDHSAGDYELVREHARLVLDPRGVTRGRHAQVIKA